MFDPYDYAEAHNIRIVPFETEEAKAFAVILREEEFVVHNPRACGEGAELRCTLAHELAHLRTGALYGRELPYETVGRIENRAEKASLRMLVPQKELEEAVARGITEVWELAEHFGVTEQAIRQAQALYCRGGLDPYPGSA